MGSPSINGTRRVENTILPKLHSLAICGCAALILSVACGAAHGELVATIRTLTGELRIRNTGTTDFFLSAYQITTPSDALSVPEWLPVSGRLDVNGDMSFDPDQAWTVLAPLEPMPATTGELSEGVFVGDGGLLAPGAVLYLGAIWDTAAPREVQVDVADDGLVPFNVPVSYVPPGDYDEDGVVDQNDLALWKGTFGIAGVGMLADGNGDQLVGLGDYTIWRDNLGATGEQSVFESIGFAASTAIPEPATAAIAILGLLLVAVLSLGRGNYCG